MKKKNEVLRKIIKSIIYVIVIICVLYNICYFLNTTITNKSYLKVFGISILNINSTSMEPEINKNDLVVTKETTEILNKNDIIVYVLNGQIRIGKIEKVNTDEGNISYIVKANNNYYPETKPIINDQIIGIVILNVFGLGFFLKILQTKIMTIIIFVILIFMFFYNRYIFLKGIERRRKKKKFRPD